MVRAHCSYTCCENDLWLHAQKEKDKERERKYVCDKNNGSD